MKPAIEQQRKRKLHLLISHLDKEDQKKLSKYINDLFDEIDQNNLETSETDWLKFELELRGFTVTKMPTMVAQNKLESYIEELLKNPCNP